MTVSTLDRRSFLKKMTAPTGPSKGLTDNTAFRRFFPEKKQMGEAELPPPPAGDFTVSGLLDPYQGPWTQTQAAHLLRRTMFGVKKADLDLLTGMTMDEAVNHLLSNLDPLPDPPVVNYNHLDPDNGDVIDPEIPEGQTWVDAQWAEEVEGYRIESWRGWWMDLMIKSEGSIQEKMVLFWHNHFSTQTSQVFHSKAIYQHHRTLRQNVLGNFKSLTRDITLDGFMLYYLNGYLNHKDSPDENYARELQELFTIGKDSPVFYTEEDVVQAAKVLTGWRPNFFTNEIYQEIGAHDEGDKQFSSFYNNTLISGNADAGVELNALLDMIFAKDEVALYLCRKLYRWFVYYKIDAAVEQQIIVPLAQMLRDNNYEILPVMQTLLKSEHFFNASQGGCFIKTPVDQWIGSLRSFNLTLPNVSLYDNFIHQYYTAYICNEMQMLPGDPPNVAGWQAFRQSPGYYRFWINSDTMRNRNIYTDALSAVGVDTGESILIIDHIGMASQFDQPEDPNLLIADLLKLMLPQPISPAKTLFLKSILLSGLANDGYWTAAWYAYQQDPTDPMAHDAVWYRLLFLHKYIMNMPEYQLA